MVPTQSQRADLAFLQQKSRVWIMGVLNATPDSFYAGSRASDAAEAAAQAETMVRDGADLLDVGGESTRPGAESVTLSAELERVLPVLDALHTRWPDTPLSIDTQKAEVARQALAHGVAMVNDISAMRHDPDMANVIADAGCAVVLMHMQGTPQTMQQSPRYSRLMDELKDFFEERLAAASRAGIAEDKIVIDPGIGFGKTSEHNLTILQELPTLASLGRPILVGLSRKAFLGRSLTPEKRLEGTLAASLQAVKNGANGLRVHDVGVTRRALS